MLSTPRYGWVDITIGDWTDRCSDISGNLPIMLLSTMDWVLTYKLPKVVKLDAEGWEYYIIFDVYETVVVSNRLGEYTAGNKRNYLAYDYSISIYDIAKELVRDIRKNIDKWTQWCTDEFDISDKRMENKNIIEELCSDLEAVFLGKVE